MMAFHVRHAAMLGFAAILGVFVLTQLAGAPRRMGTPVPESAAPSAVDPRITGTTPYPLVCVTPQGFCHTATMAEGDPCSCPHPLRGNTRGHARGLQTLLDNPSLVPVPAAGPTPREESARERSDSDFDALSFGP